MSKADSMALDSYDVLELNRVLPLPETKEGVPEWLPLVEAAAVITGRDGRQYANPGPEIILTNTTNRGVDVPMDVEHATELVAPQGKPAPAVGWFTDYKVVDGVLLGKIEWNQEGGKILSSRTYRYYSPTYRVSRGENRQILFIKSVGLTNSPNLALPALNHEEGSIEGEGMKIPASIIMALALNADAMEADVLSAITALKSATETNAEKIKDLVPKADYEIVLNRAATAESELNTLKAAGLKMRAEAAVDQAVKDGKIAPASKEYHLTSCNSEEGLKRFVDFMATSSPVVQPNAEEAPAGSAEESKSELNAEEAALADQMGLSEKEAMEAFGKEKK